MKTSLTKLSSSFLLLSLSFTVWAKPVAQVVEVKGTVFMVTPEGTTTALKVNQHLEDKAEVMVEEGASITLNDYYDAGNYDGDEDGDDDDNDGNDDGGGGDDVNNQDDGNDETLTTTMTIMMVTTVTTSRCA